MTPLMPINLLRKCEMVTKFVVKFCAFKAHVILFRLSRVLFYQDEFKTGNCDHFVFAK